MYTRITLVPIAVASDQSEFTAASCHQADGHAPTASDQSESTAASCHQADGHAPTAGNQSPPQLVVTKLMATPPQPATNQSTVHCS